MQEKDNVRENFGPDQYILSCYNGERNHVPSVTTGNYFSTTKKRKKVRHKCTSGRLVVGGCVLKGPEDLQAGM